MLTRPLSKKEGYDHRIPTAMARISRFGTINPTDMSKTKSTKFTVSVKAATKKFDLVSRYIAAKAGAIGRRLSTNGERVNRRDFGFYFVTMNRLASISPHPYGDR
jgi:hypothetical protein